MMVVSSAIMFQYLFINWFSGTDFAAFASEKPLSAMVRNSNVHWCNHVVTKDLLLEP
jgi:hypothetical protein